MQNKKQRFLFSFPRCRLTSPRSGKVVKAEDNAKQKTKYFVFIVEAHPNFAAQRQSSIKRAKCQIYLSISDFRLKNKKRDFWKVVRHELSHSFFNLPHCPNDDPHCIVKDAKGHPDFSNKEHLCKSCTEKIQL